MQGATSSQPIHLVVAAVVLAVLITGCGPTTTKSTSTADSSSSDAAATPTLPQSFATDATRQTSTVGLVVSRTRVANGYRVVLAAAQTRSDGSVVAVPHRPKTTYVIPTSWVPHGYMLNGLIEVETDGRRVSGISILG